MTTEHKDFKDAVDKLGTTFEEFKKTSKEVHEQQMKGYVDPLLKAQQDKLNQVLTEAEDAKETAEKAMLAVKRASMFESKDKDPLVAHQRKEIMGFLRTGRGGNDNDGDKKSIDTLAIAQAAQKSYSSSSDVDGGFAVIPYFDRNILVITQEEGAMRKVSGQVTIGTDEYKRPVTIDNNDVYWADDHTPRTNTQPNQFKMLSIKVHNLVAQIPIPQNLLDDAYFNLEDEIMQEAGRKFGYEEGRVFVQGDGIAQPRGVLTYPAGTAWGQVEQIPSLNAIEPTYEGLINLTYSIKNQYQTRAKFLMNRLTVAEYRKLVSTTGVPLWQPSLIAGEPSTLLGYQILQEPNLPAFATNALAVLFGDFSVGYKIVDRMGMTVLRDPYTAHPNVVFKFTKRVGGGVQNFEAIKIQKIAAS